MLRISIVCICGVGSSSSSGSSPLVQGSVVVEAGTTWSRVAGNS